MGIECICPTCDGLGGWAEYDTTIQCADCKGKGFVSRKKRDEINKKKQDDDTSLEGSREGGS